jgi:hypothetical protein
MRCATFVTERLDGVRMIETVRADVPLSVLLGVRPQPEGVATAGPMITPIG